MNYGQLKKLKKHCIKFLIAMLNIISNTQVNHMFCCFIILFQQFNPHKRYQLIAGFAGINCQENINDCLNVNCHNGSCVDMLNTYQCSCLSGYTGTHCEIETNVCDSQPCQYGGSCFSYHTSDGLRYECRCLPGTSGKCSVWMTSGLSSLEK